MKNRLKVLFLFILTILLVACGDKYQVDEKMRMSGFKEVNLPTDGAKLEEISYMDDESNDERFNLVKVQDGVIYGISTNPSSDKNGVGYFIKIDKAGNVEKLLMDEKLHATIFATYRYSIGDKIYCFAEPGTNDLYSFDYKTMELQNLGEVEDHLEGIGCYIQHIKDDRVYYVKTEDDAGEGYLGTKLEFDIKVYDMNAKSLEGLDIDLQDYDLDGIETSGVSYYDGKVYYSKINEDIRNQNNSSIHVERDFYELDLEEGSLELILKDDDLEMVSFPVDRMVFFDYKVDSLDVNNVYAKVQGKNAFKYGIKMDKKDDILMPIGLEGDRYFKLLKSSGNGDVLVVLDLEEKTRYNIELFNDSGLDRTIKDGDYFYISTKKKLYRIGLGDE